MTKNEIAKEIAELYGLETTIEDDRLRVVVRGDLVEAVAVSFEFQHDYPVMPWETMVGDEDGTTILYLDFKIGVK